jgi:hypothetical protein
MTEGVAKIRRGDSGINSHSNCMKVSDLLSVPIEANVQFLFERTLTLGVFAEPKVGVLCSDSHKTRIGTQVIVQFVPI